MKTLLKDATIKQCIDVALEKANTAVGYDTANDFHNAIAAYTEAVELLVFVLQHPSKGNDTEGMKSICNIYLERIDFLSYLKMSEENGSKPALTIIPTRQQQDISSSSPTSPQHSKFNTVLMNIFAKKTTKKKKTVSGSSFSNHSNIFNFAHNQKDAHKSIDIQPKSSKSSPMFPIKHSKWNRQARNKTHHMSSDNILPHQYQGRSLSYTSPAPINDMHSTPLYFQQPKYPHEDDEFCIPKKDNNDMVRPTTVADDHPNEQRCPMQFSAITDKQYNTSFVGHSGSYCYTEALPIPKKSSQRQKRISPPAPLTYTEPIRDSSLHATGQWRSANRPSPPKSPNSSLPPPISDKSANRASATVMANKRVSSLRLKTTFSLTTPTTIKSGGTISHNTSNLDDSNDQYSGTTLSPCSSIPDSPIRTIEIDPSIILNYPEAQVTVSNENIMNTFGSNLVDTTVI